jgi:uncharacterized protein YjeT (DUF2065 family)
MAGRSLSKLRILEILGLLMIGDGMLAATRPSRYMVMWIGGPRAWRKAMTFLAERPALTRAIGVTELAAGLWVALRAQPGA